MDFHLIDQKLRNEFTQKKIKAEKLAENNNSLTLKSPEFVKIDSKIRKLILEISKLDYKQMDSKKQKEELAKLEKEKEKILKNLNLKASDLKPKYSCDKCCDVGFIGGEFCSCYQKRRNEEIVKACGLSLSKLHDFDDYNTKICKANDEKHAKSLEVIKEKLEKWTVDFPNVKKTIFLFLGMTGVGKTYLMETVASQMLKKKYSICFISAFDMNNMFLNFNSNYSKEKHSWIDPLIESDFLFIDDLGTEPIYQNVTINHLYLILSERERFNRPIFISTNMLPDNIMEHYGERIYSRLFNKSKAYNFHIEGKDLRI